MAVFFWHDDYIGLLDASELLIHDGADEAPLWRQSVDSDIVGLVRVGQEVATLDKGGKLRYWDLAQGHETQLYDIPDNPIGLSLPYENRFVVLTNKEALLFEDGRQLAQQTIKMPASAAFSADGSRIAVLSATGACTVCNANLEPIRTSDVTEMFGREIAWSEQGHWLAASGKGLYKISADAQWVSTVTQGENKISNIAINHDGSRFVIVMDDKLAIMRDSNNTTTLAQVRMTDRTITGVSATNEAWLDLSLAGGDGNRVSLVQEWLVKRTDTHPGRKHNSWDINRHYWK